LWRSQVLSEASFRRSQFRGEAKSFGRSSIRSIYNIAVDSARRAEFEKTGYCGAEPLCSRIIGFGLAADA